MRNLIIFLRKYLHIILFGVLGGICIFFLYGSSAYRQWALKSFMLEISSPIYQMQNNITEYFHLKHINQELVEQNKLLLDKTTNIEIIADNSKSIDSSQAFLFEYQPAKVISSSINLQNNVIILDKGSKDGITPDMGVISPQGIVGIVKEVSPNFSMVLSMLSSQFNVSVKTKRTEVVGVLTWDGRDYRYMQFGNLTNIESINIGDTIISHYSLMFPPDYPIGVISGGLKNKAIGGYYTLQVKLLSKLDNLHDVYIVKSHFADELNALTESDKNE